MTSIYKIVTEKDYPFQSDFDYKQIESRILMYKQNGIKDKKYKKQLLIDIATSSCFKELRIMLVNLLESKIKKGG